MHFDWTSSSRHCSSAAGIFHFGEFVYTQTPEIPFIAFSARYQKNKRGSTLKPVSKIFICYLKLGGFTPRPQSPRAPPCRKQSHKSAYDHTKTKQRSLKRSRKLDGMGVARIRMFPFSFDSEGAPNDQTFPKASGMP